MNNLNTKNNFPIKNKLQIWIHEKAKTQIKEQFPIIKKNCLLKVQRFVDRI